MSTRNRITTTILATLLGASALGSVALASSLDASQLQAIRVSAEQALVTAELQVQGSKAVELELEQGQQQAYYEVKLLGADSKHEVKIDAVDGAVLSTRDKQASGAANKLQGVKVSAAQAASNAEKLYAGGKAVKVDLEREKGQLLYEVDVVTPQQKYEVLVDAASGQVLSAEKNR